MDVRERDTQRDREPKRARDLTLRDSCTDNSMQFGTRTTAAEPGFMGTWPNTDTNLLFRMSQQVSYFHFFFFKKRNIELLCALFSLLLFFLNVLEIKKNTYFFPHNCVPGMCTVTSWLP